MPRQGIIESLQVGKPAAMRYGRQELYTGINKEAVHGPLFLNELNLEGDGQGDLKHHGGPDKAVCVYPYEHYAYWEKELNRKLAYGAFGENVTASGLTESDVCLGDTYRLGRALVQVSQPRQPCFKLARKHDVPDLAQRVQLTGLTGYYFRVLEKGEVSPGDAIRLVDRHPLQVTVEAANGIAYHEPDNREGLLQLLEVKELSKSWREWLRPRLEAMDR
ncbi:MOSC domain-containing protein [Paenibacillus sp. CC-CFT747]|nr:MOSC domain-containing protein [Paenibacillus sp. CC-CFT747]